MAENVGTMIQDVMDETHWPSESASIIRHLVSSLRHYRQRRFYFSEKSGTFSTVAGTSAYPRGAGGYPADLLSIDNLRVVSGSGEIILEQRSFEAMRDLQSNSTASRNSPGYYSFFADQLILFPTPGSVWTVHLDYLFDATLDSATGVEIDGTVAALTNDYFSRGAEMLRTRIIYALSLGRAQDPTLAIQMKTLNSEAESSLTRETVLRKMGSSFTVDRCF